MSRLPDYIHFTMLPNFILDEELGELSGGEIKLLLYIYRKTVGFGEKNDEIAYSQFIKNTGLSRSTISTSIESLQKKKLIKVDKTGVTNKYSYCLPKNDSDNKKAKLAGSIIKLEGVQKSNNQPVRKSNTQKKTIKETIKDTTSRSDLSDDVLEAIQIWNNSFKRQIDLRDQENVYLVKSALKKFSIEQIRKALFNRSLNDFYKEIPWTRDNPKMFFGKPDFIENDIVRTPKGLFSYDEMINKVTSSNKTTEDFEMTEHLDDNGNRLWKEKQTTL
ncbi:MAG TPA: replication protein [Balneolaceae bacterium]